MSKKYWNEELEHAINSTDRNIASIKSRLRKKKNSRVSDGFTTSKDRNKYGEQSSITNNRPARSTSTYPFVDNDRLSSQFPSYFIGSSKDSQSSLTAALRAKIEEQDKLIFKLNNTLLIHDDELSKLQDKFTHLENKLESSNNELVNIRSSLLRQGVIHGDGQIQGHSVRASNDDQIELVRKEVKELTKQLKHMGRIDRHISADQTDISHSISRRQSDERKKKGVKMSRRELRQLSLELSETKRSHQSNSSDDSFESYSKIRTLSPSLNIDSPHDQLSTSLFTTLLSDSDLDQSLCLNFSDESDVEQYGSHVMAAGATTRGNSGADHLEEF